MSEIFENIGLMFRRVISVFGNFDFPSDLLDILFVAVMIYGLIRLIRQTRSAQLLKGLVLLVVAYGAIKLFNMRVSGFIFDQIFGQMLLFAIVLFHPEIRNVFESVGRSNVSRFRAMTQMNRAAQERGDIARAIHQVCEAFRGFSAERNGALVVFEHVTKLGEILKTGTTIQARVSRELIRNIFYASAPLHDGAVIIRKGILEGAGCILPLTQENHVDPSLGTRHRAALGMSEQSDAIVAVVSEETGQISLAIKSKLRRDLTPEELEQALCDALLDPDSGRTPLQLAKTFFTKSQREKEDDAK